MRSVTLQAIHPNGTPVPSDEEITVELWPLYRRELNGSILNNRRQVHTFTGSKTVSLETTTPEWVWVARITPKNMDSWTEFFPLLPGEPVQYADLIKTTIVGTSPGEQPEESWWAYARAAVIDAEKVNGRLVVTRADGTVTDLGRVDGLPGATGTTPALKVGEVVTGAPGTPAEVVRTRSPLTGDYTDTFTIPTGAPGGSDQSFADWINDDESLTGTALKDQTAQVVWDVSGPTGTVEGDKAVVLAACQLAETEGRTVVTLAPGHYLLDGVTVADALHRRLFGDGVTFSWQSNVYPFSTEDTATLAGDRGRHGGRGRIAIEVDDALTEHWRYLFPATKRLGITVGTAWHTDNGAEWIAEAYRHGWEVIHHLPENITAVDYLAAGTLETAIVSGLDKIEAEIGTREGIGFVYPQHVRSDETDRVLSKYFTRGRGLSEFITYPKDTGHPWYVSAAGLDAQFTGGKMSATLKDWLRQISTMDSQAVFYLHLHSDNQASQITALTEMVEWCRFLGIDIVNPGQIWTDRNILKDPYINAGGWVPGGNAALDAAIQYHDGSSLKATPVTGSLTGWATGERVAVPSRPGMFGVYRASLRYKADAPVSITSAGQGFLWTAAFSERSVAGGAPIGGAYTPCSPAFPATGTTIPAANWTRTQTLIYVPPSAVAATPRLSIQNVAAGSSPVWVDELKWEHLDWVPSVTYTATLIGTGNVTVVTGIANVGSHTIQVVPDILPAGTVHVAGVGNNLITVKSTNAADTMGVKIIITPRSSYATMALPSTGA